MSKEKPTQKTRYFEHATDWANDYSAHIEGSRNRYRAAFLSTMVLSVSLATAIAVMMPLKQTEPLLIHHYDNGITTVERAVKKHQTLTQAQIESDLVRYVVMRESFDVTSYRAQFELVSLLSSPETQHDYEQSQRKTNPLSPLNTLGTQTSRQVHVYSVQFIDHAALNDKELKGRSKNHHDLAEVVFSVIDKNKTQGIETEHHFTALIAWQYLGMPASPDARWKNVNGFEITRYSIQQRNV